MSPTLELSDIGDCNGQALASNRLAPVEPEKSQSKRSRSFPECSNIVGEHWGGKAF